MENPPVQGPVFLIEIEKIVPNPHQPRKEFDETALRELAESIREFGVLQPIVVTKIEWPTETGTEVQYQLIAGERRWRAAYMAGLERIPAVIRSVNLEKDKLELAIIENVQRENLNPIEAARAYAKLQDEFGMTQREIASRLGKSRESVANTIRLLNLPSEIQEAVAGGKISESQGRLLLTVTEIPRQAALFHDILSNSLSVRELKSRIQSLPRAAATETEEEIQHADPETAALQKELEEKLGTKVKLEKTGPSGKITITFYSPEELYNIINRLAGEASSQKNSPSETESLPENFTY